MDLSRGRRGRLVSLSRASSPDALRTLLLAALVVAPALLAVSPVASADAIVTTGHALAAGRASGAAVWSGSKIYYFGGTDSSLNPRTEITSYDPATGAVTHVANLPAPGRQSHAAVWHAGSAYVLGGSASGVGTNTIVKFTPPSTVVTLPVTLPAPLASVSAVSDGTYIYVFGGLDGNTNARSDKIHRLHPATNTITTLASTLPSARDSTAAVWDPAGGNAYIVGGFLASSTETGEIVRFRPSTGTVTTVATLPVGIRGHGAVWTGSAVVTLGGQYHDKIYRYTPYNNTVHQLVQKLPTARYFTTAAFANGAAYVLGGRSDGTPTGLQLPIPKLQIAATSVPIGVTAGYEEAAVTWALPESDGGTVVAGWHVYRRYAYQIPEYVSWTLVATRPSTATSWTDPVFAGDYVYRVAAFDATDTDFLSSPSSPVVEVYTSPDPPGCLDVEQVGAEVSVSWCAPESDGNSEVATYHLYRDGAHVAYIDGETTSYLDAPPYPGPLVLTYEVAAMTLAGEGPLASAGLFYYGEPTSVAPLGASAPAANQVALTWSAPSSSGGGPITYLVDELVDGEWFLIEETASTSTTLTGVSRGAHTYGVRATNGARTGPQATATISAFDLPTAPQGLTGAGLTNAVSMTWSAPANTGGGTLNGYRVYRLDPSTSTYAFLADVAGTSHTDAGLTPGSYSYKVAARVGPADQVGPQTGPLTRTAIGIPYPPRNVTIAQTADGALQMTWQAPAVTNFSAIAQYHVYRYDVGLGSFQYETSVGPSTFSLFRTGLAPGNHTYHVVAQNGAGTSNPSPSVTQRIINAPAPPTNLRAGGVAANTVRLTWNASVADGGQGPITYIIERSDNGGGSFSGRGATAGLDFTDTDAHGTVQYRVYALNGANKASTKAGPMGYTTWEVPSAPQNVVAVTNGNEGELQVIWQASANAGGAGRSIVGYEVYARNATDANVRVLGFTTGTSLVATRQPVAEQVIWVKAVNDWTERGVASGTFHAQAVHTQDDPGGHGDAGDSRFEATVLPFQNGVVLDARLVPFVDSFDYYRIDIPGTDTACFQAAGGNGRDIRLVVHEPRTSTAHTFASTSMGAPEGACVTASDGNGPGTWIIGIADEAEDLVKCVVDEATEPPQTTTTQDVNGLTSCFDARPCIDGQTCGLVVEGSSRTALGSLGYSFAACVGACAPFSGRAFVDLAMPFSAAAAGRGWLVGHELVLP